MKSQVVMTPVVSNIPIPPMRRATSPVSNRLCTLQVGQSFAVRSKDPKSIRRMIKKVKQKMTNWNFTTRTLSEEGQPVIRVWRTA